MVQQKLIDKFNRREARGAVIGLGYVGLPLAVVFAEAGYSMVGIDVDKNKVDAVNRGESYIEDIPQSRLDPLVLRQPLSERQSEKVAEGTVESEPVSPDPPPRLIATTDYSILLDCDAVSICVPTPLGKTSEPDISYVLSAARAIGEFLHPGMLIILESTTYPGTTREIILQELESSRMDLEVGKDYFLAFSPERVDPGREDWTTKNTPKVIGGVTPACLEVAAAYYQQAIDQLVPVSSPETAEMVKLFENTFRMVNIGLANELLMMCDKLGLDAWEVLTAADTKPFGFMKFTPGPGLGGHCIPIDPHYLSWKLRTLEYNARFIELASEINTSMPRFWVQRIQDVLNDGALAVKGSRILLLGVAYKRDVSDLRESPALDILHLLQEKGAHVSYHDPHIPRISMEGLELTSERDLDQALQEADCVVITTDHSDYDWARIRVHSSRIVDTRYALGGTGRK